MIVASKILRRTACAAYHDSGTSEANHQWFFFVCRSLASTRDALDDTSDYDLIFLDNCLPDGLGIDFLAEACEHTPYVILVSADAGDAAFTTEAIQRGACGVLEKPYLPQEILKFLHS